MIPHNLNGSTLSFPQDGKLQFEEQSHTYTIDNIGNLTSVSRVISHFFEPFDAEYWSLRKAHGNPDNAARLRDEWECKGAIASQTGTFMHKQIENYLNGQQHPETICHVDYKGKYLQISEDVPISREWGFFMSFNSQTVYHPFRTEWAVFDTDARIAGTIDLICACEDGTYEIFDWKRSNKIDPNEINRRSHGKHGLEHLTDTSYTHYCLQQNLYRYLVEKNYGLKISRMRLVILHPENDNYHIVTIPKMDREVELIIDYFTHHF